ncbi:MAG: hypothetical protein Q4G24_08905 [Paracoccus sp. (in: a-proteobacteria)]|uniref:hypothetical protein n=1 Tax=Paracoccus sp. TaxID=267 RepID=UPI0026E0B9F7|nr:hypothetical protein [Paracoccus sp. (in: a-proteobacteria)]MDO5621573.1 hypothetical protein [Paracoccus sp. (in: a-proteobacteria)]
MSRPGADLVQVARDRVALNNRRGAQRLAGVAPLGRVAGRLAHGLPLLPDDLDMQAPALVLLLLPPQQAGEVLEAAAAALVGHDLAQAITPESRAAQAGLVSDQARRFALHHRHLSAPPAGEPLPERLELAQSQIRAAWLGALPAPLAQEFGASVPLTDTPVLDAPAQPQPQPPARRRQPLLRRRKPQVLPLTQPRHASADRPQAALDAAMDAFGQRGKP